MSVMQILEVGGVKLRQRTLKRDPNPLSQRRVRHLETGRTGTIDRAWVTVTGPDASVHWDDMEKSWHTERVVLTDCEVLDAPQITEPVYVRKVVFRGHKEQVAEWLAQHAPLSPAALEAGARRYVEFDPNCMAYRRWRVIYSGPPMDQEAVDATPDEAPGADRRRKDAHDAAYDHDEPNGYGL